MTKLAQTHKRRRYKLESYEVVFVVKWLEEIILPNVRLIIGWSSLMHLVHDLRRICLALLELDLFCFGLHDERVNVEKIGEITKFAQDWWDHKICEGVSVVESNASIYVGECECCWGFDLTILTRQTSAHASHALVQTKLNESINA